MIHVFHNRQCSAFQPVVAHHEHHPLHVNAHGVVPPTAMKAPPELVNDDESPTEGKANDESTWGKVCKSFLGILVVILATVATYVLHNNVEKIDPVLASGIVAIASNLLLSEKMALSALCGSFAGMVQTAVVPTIWSATLLGLLCAGVLVLFDRMKWFLGYGGRLGFISQCACTLQFLASELVTKTLGSTTSNEMLADFDMYDTHSDRIKAELPLVVLFTVVGALFLRVYKRLTAKLPNKVSNSVAAVGLTGIIGGFLPSTMGGPAYCGSFVAMASPAILPNAFALASASIFAGLSQVALAGLLNDGWGGKLGTAAFMGVVIYRWLEKAATFVTSLSLRNDTIKAAQERIANAFQTQAQVLPR